MHNWTERERSCHVGRPNAHNAYSHSTQSTGWYKSGRPHTVWQLLLAAPEGPVIPVSHSVPAFRLHSDTHTHTHTLRCAVLRRAALNKLKYSQVLMRRARCDADAQPLLASFLLCKLPPTRTTHLAHRTSHLAPRTLVFLPPVCLT